MGKCIIQKVEYSKLRRVLYEWAESCLFKTSDRKKKIKIDGLTRRYLELVIPSFFGFCTLKHSRSGRLVNFMAIECSSIASMLRFYFINATVSMPQCSILNAKHFQNWRHSVRLWLYKGVLLHVMRMFSIWLAKFWMLSKMRCNIFCSLTALNVFTLYFSFAHAFACYTWACQFNTIKWLLFKAFQIFWWYEIWPLFCSNVSRFERHWSTQNESHPICLN